MDYKYYLPNGTSQPVEYTTHNNSVILIGANGSGKSKLGEWMEKRDETTSHRVGAQRSLIFGNYIQQKSYEQATNMLLYGQENGS
jgi:recombinational DNA repair ATPase RecF